MVNRGFVPDGRQDAKSRSGGELSGPVDIMGALRWPDPRHWFTPNDDPAHNLWFTADPASMAAAKGIGQGPESGPDEVAPFYVEQEDAGAARRPAAARQTRGRAARQPPAICADLVRSGGRSGGGFHLLGFSSRSRGGKNET